jgi:hypothetical protein
LQSAGELIENGLRLNQGTGAAAGLAQLTLGNAFIAERKANDDVGGIDAGQIPGVFVRRCTRFKTGLNRDGVVAIFRLVKQLPSPLCHLPSQMPGISTQLCFIAGTIGH